MKSLGRPHGAFKVIMKNSLFIEASRGYCDNQFIRNRYTLMVTTQVDDGDALHCCWEFGNGEPPRYMGHTSGSEVVARIAGALKEVTERLEP